MNENGAFITIGEARDLAKAYSQQFPNNSAGHTFDKALVQHLLDTPGCNALRIFIGLDEASGEFRLILTPAKDETRLKIKGLQKAAKNNSIRASAVMAFDDNDDAVLDRGGPCPPPPCEL